MKAKDRGFRQGYRDAVTGCELDWQGVSRRWRDGYKRGQEEAIEDLEWRIAFSRPEDRPALRRAFRVLDGGKS